MRLLVLIKTLLAYLVRRLLEKWGKLLFVNRIVDEQVSIDELVESPIDIVKANGISQNPLTPPPRHIYGDRKTRLDWI